LNVEYRPTVISKTSLLNLTTLLTSESNVTNSLTSV
jgi:hypothetical protein